MTAPNGDPVHAVYGFLRLLFKLIRDRKPTHLAIAFDQKGPSFRNEIYPKYKANRPPPPEDLPAQYALCIEATEALNIPALYAPLMEADDVIGTLVTQWCAQEKGACVIVSADKDMSQLVNDQVTLWDGKDREMGRAQVIERMGVAPELIIDLLGLAGDASDNIPGVPGIGPKTATKLLNEFGSLETLLERASEVKGKRGLSLVEFADQARLSAILATIKRDAPLDLDFSHLLYDGPNMTATIELLTRLNFKSILVDLRVRYEANLEMSPPGEEVKVADALTSKGPPHDLGPDPHRSSESKTEWMTPLPHPAIIDRTQYLCVLTLGALEEVVVEIKKARLMSLDLETTSLHPHSADILGIALAWAPNQAVYIPLDHHYLGAPEQLDATLVWRTLAPLLEDESLPKVGQNIKYEQKVLMRAGVIVKGWRGDPMLMAHLLDASRSHFGLDALTLDLLGHKNLTFKEVAGAKGADDRFSAVMVDRATEYAGEDADVTLRLYQLLAPQLSAEPRLNEIYMEIELPLTETLAEMEVHGIKLDETRLNSQNHETLKKLQVLQAEIHQLAGREFNVDSPVQLSKVLFEDLGLKGGKKTKTGYSTKHEVLEKLSDAHPIIKLLLEYRHLAKLRNTYLKALPQLIHPSTQRVHTSFKQTGTVTGRLSSSDPNLQNIPLRTPEGRAVREAFVTREGWRLISADYSQVELRLLAHFARAEQMIKGFKEGIDIHSRTAADVFGCAIDELTSDQRRSAKAINFGLMYGMGAFRLAQTLKVSRKEAQQMIDQYFTRYGEVRAYFQEAVEEARIHSETYTLMGRRRPLPEINVGRGSERQHAERLAVNTPIQGTAADILKLAMVKLHRLLKAENLQARILLTVHDELVLEAPLDEVEHVVALTKEAMEGAYTLSLPLKVEVGVGSNWAEIH